MKTEVIAIRKMIARFCALQQCGPFKPLIVVSEEVDREGGQQMYHQERIKNPKEVNEKFMSESNHDGVLDGSGWGRQRLFNEPAWPLHLCLVKNARDVGMLFDQV